MYLSFINSDGYTGYGYSPTLFTAPATATLALEIRPPILFGVAFLLAIIKSFAYVLCVVNLIVLVPYKNGVDSKCKGLNPKKFSSDKVSVYVFFTTSFLTYATPFVTLIGLPNELFKEDTALAASVPNALFKSTENPFLNLLKVGITFLFNNILFVVIAISLPFLTALLV